MHAIGRSGDRLYDPSTVARLASAASTSADQICFDLPPCMTVIFTMKPSPQDIQLIGDTVAIKWTDGREDYIPMETLRAASPSAENVGEPDIFGRIIGGDSRTSFPGITVRNYEYVGQYAIRFIFSDGHQTGLYSYSYLRSLVG